MRTLPIQPGLRSAIRTKRVERNRGPFCLLYRMNSRCTTTCPSSREYGFNSDRHGGMADVFDLGITIRLCAVMHYFLVCMLATPITAYGYLLISGIHEIRIQFAGPPQVVMPKSGHSTGYIEISRNMRPLVGADVAGPYVSWQNPCLRLCWDCVILDSNPQSRRHAGTFVYLRHAGQAKEAKKRSVNCFTSIGTFYETLYNARNICVNKFCGSTHLAKQITQL